MFHIYILCVHANIRTPNLYLKLFGPMVILLYKVQKEHETRDMFKSFAEIS